MKHLPTNPSAFQEGAMNTMVDFGDMMVIGLAGTIADLLNKHEPLLKAEHDGTEITVSEKGGPLAFSVTVESAR